MRYASVCDGIGAAHVAWRPFGWECAWTSEIEPFPAAVVDQRFGYRNLGDMTKLTEEQLDGCGPISLLVGGTPCQSFSVAGLRKGLADPRGNLALRFVQLVGVLRPTWVVWENVPGVLSSAGGRDFGTFLGALGELGYGFAYRVLDAQWFGVAQRRRRVFVVAHARDWRRAAAVLFERESLFGDTPTRGEAGQGTAGGPALRARANSSHRADTQAFVPEVSPALKARDFKGPSSDGDGDGASLVPVAQSFYSTESRCDNLPPPDVAPPLKVGSNGGWQPPAVAFKPSHYTRGKDGSPSEITPPLSADADKGDQDTVVAFDTTQITSASNYSRPKPGDPCHPLAAGAHPPAIAVAFTQNSQDEARQIDGDGQIAGALSAESRSHQTNCIAFANRTRDGIKVPEVMKDGVVPALTNPGQGGRSDAVNVLAPVAIDFENVAETGDATGTLDAEGQRRGNRGHGVIQPAACVNMGGDKGGASVAVDGTAFTLSTNEPHAVHTPMAVRRLTPRECERLQGFPDDYTLVTYRNKPAADGPRYKALGNSMAVPVMAWIGRRIAEVEVLP